MSISKIKKQIENKFKTQRNFARNVKQHETMISAALGGWRKINDVEAAIWARLLELDKKDLRSIMNK